MKRHILSSRVRHAWGMTLVETLISALAVVALFAFISAVSASLGADDAQTRTQDTLAVLQEALRHAPKPLPDDTALVLQRLLSHPSTATMLAGVIRQQTSASGEDNFVWDAYGHRLVYRPGATPQSLGQFVSAGPDGRFGDAFSKDPATRRAEADNLYGCDTEGAMP